jgi:hypothetical protein
MDLASFLSRKWLTDSTDEAFFSVNSVEERRDIGFECPGIVLAIRACCPDCLFHPFVVEKTETDFVVESGFKTISKVIVQCPLNDSISYRWHTNHTVFPACLLDEMRR